MKVKYASRPITCQNDTSEYDTCQNYISQYDTISQNDTYKRQWYRHHNDI